MREIAGRKPLTDVKAKVWRIFAEVTSDNKLGLDEPDGITRIAECIGMVYGIDAETVLEELPLNGIMSTFGECYGYLSDLIAGKLPKNVDGDGAM